jgi:hypothetical protein
MLTGSGKDDDAPRSTTGLTATRAVPGRPWRLRKRAATPDVTTKTKILQTESPRAPLLWGSGVVHERPAGQLTPSDASCCAAHALKRPPPPQTRRWPTQPLPTMRAAQRPPPAGIFVNLARPRGRRSTGVTGNSGNKIDAGDCPRVLPHTIATVLAYCHLTASTGPAPTFNTLRMLLVVPRRRFFRRGGPRSACATNGAAAAATRGQVGRKRLNTTLVLAGRHPHGASPARQSATLLPHHGNACFAACISGTCLVEV